MFSWSLSKGLLCLPFTSSFSVLISYNHCDKSLQTCWKQQEYISQFCRLEVQHESHWATVMVLGGLYFFLWGKNPFPCYFQLLQLTHDSFLPSSKPAALHFWSFFSSVQSLSCAWLFLIPWTAARQASCPSPTPGVYLNSCPLRWWCHPTISSFVVPFSLHLQSFPASGSFQMSHLLASGGQSIRVSVSASVLPKSVLRYLYFFQTLLFCLPPLLLRIPVIILGPARHPRLIYLKVSWLATLIPSSALFLFCHIT